MEGRERRQTSFSVLLGPATTGVSEARGKHPETNSVPITIFSEQGNPTNCGSCPALAVAFAEKVATQTSG